MFYVLLEVTILSASPVPDDNLLNIENGVVLGGSMTHGNGSSILVTVKTAQTRAVELIACDLGGESKLKKNTSIVTGEWETWEGTFDRMSYSNLVKVEFNGHIECFVAYKNRLTKPTTFLMHRDIGAMAVYDYYKGRESKMHLKHMPKYVHKEPDLLWFAIVVTVIVVSVIVFEFVILPLCEYKNSSKHKIP